MSINKLSKFVLCIGVIMGLVGGVLASPTTPTITSNDCTMTISFTTDQAGAHRVYIVDDFAVIFDQTQAATAAGQSLTVSYTLDAVPGEVVPGVSVYIEVDGNEVFAQDFYEEIVQTCDPTAITTDAPANCVGIPDTATGAIVTQTTRFYWATDLEKFSQGGETLNPGDAVIVTGIDPAGEFYRIVFACGAYWVPVASLAPNPDAIWLGRPLSIAPETDG